MPTTFPVDSSNLSAIGFEGNELTVDFKNGTRYVYSGVPYAVFKQIAEAESKGKAFNELVKKGSYPFKKVEKEDNNG